MLDLLLAVGLVVAAAAEKPICSTDALGYCQDPTVTYSLNDGVNKLKVKIKLGTVFVVRLPEGEKLTSPPAVGNQAFVRAEVKKEEGGGQTLRIWPSLPETMKGGDPAGVEGLTTNVQATFQSSKTIILEIQLSTTAPGVELLLLRDPEREEMQRSRADLRAEIRQELEQELQKRKDNLTAEAHKEALDLMADGIMERFNCEGLRERAMRDLLVVWGRRICHIGNYLFIVFEIENRSRSQFELGKVEFFGVKGDKLEPHEAVVAWRGKRKPELRFDQSAKGCGVIPLAEEETSPEYAIKVTEAGGKMRVVTLKGIKF